MTDSSNPLLFLFCDYALFIGNHIESDVHLHSHHLLKIFIPINHTFNLEYRGAWKDAGLSIIAPDEPHRFAHESGNYAVLYLDAESDIAKRIIKEYLLEKGGVSFLPVSTLWPIREKILALQNSKPCLESAKSVCDEVMRILLAANYMRLTMMDSRIKKAIALLKCSPEKKIKIRQLAMKVNLSESRLMHLFTSYVGVPIRHYELWLRLLDAIGEIIAGSSFTDAAYGAGFSDSAHLSRTFRDMFGLTLLDVFNSTKIAGSFKYS
jgi:AraC-like DNA-binding protein